MIRKSLFLFIISVSFSYAQFLGPKISVQQTEHDFGDIEAGKKVSHYFVLTNTGDDYLQIKNVHASCGCTAAKPEKDKLAPGESTRLKVEFNSEGRKGLQNKTVNITTNDPKKPELMLRIKGNVVNKTAAGSASPDLFFPATSYNFGKMKEGDIGEYTFRFLNKGNAVLEIKNVSTSCGCTAALVSSKKIEPGKEGTLRIELDTKNREGVMSRHITIVSNDPDEPSKVLTIYANVEK